MLDSLGHVPGHSVIGVIQILPKKYGSRFRLVLTSDSNIEMTLSFIETPGRVYLEMTLLRYGRISTKKTPLPLRILGQCDGR